MVNEEFTAKWHQLRGIIKELWGELSGNDIDFIDGQRERLIGKLQEKYSISEREARRKVDNLSEHL